VYIHEFIDIRGHHRAKYMHHMTANWSPAAQERRGQLCYGVWAVLGSTGRWPQVVNLWEERGWDGLASSFAGEAVGPGAQDPDLERWWAEAAAFRSGGTDRILVPHPSCAGINELTRSNAGGAVYAHELVTVAGGNAAALCELAVEAAPTAEMEGWRLLGAFATAMRNDDEALLLWAITDWEAWAAGERALSVGSAQRNRDSGSRPREQPLWRNEAQDLGVRNWERILLVDAPLSPLRTGRQPRTTDQVGWPPA
jgi:hypothetical protein